jgi:hypothetical protein
MRRQMMGWQFLSIPASIHSLFRRNVIAGRLDLNQIQAENFSEVGDCIIG